MQKHCFKIKASNTLLTDRGSLALFDEYLQRTGILEEDREIKTDRGFGRLVNLGHMPGQDAVGDWLRRHGVQALAQTNLFGGGYKYYVIISNTPKTSRDAREVLHFHNGRGNAEKFIEDAKYGLNLRVVPTGQMHVNALYSMIGMLVFNLIKLMQLTTLPEHWRNRMISSVRHKLLRDGCPGNLQGHQLWLAIRASAEKIAVI